MVDIKGLDKARVLKALCERSEYLREEMMQMDLSGDEFDERGYDSAFGAGTAQRAVDSVRTEKEGGGDAAGNADGEKKELSMEEKAELSRVAIIKILEMLKELPPDVCATTCMMLKMALPGPLMGGLVGLMMGGPVAPPMGGFLGMKTSVHITDELDRAPFPFKGR